LVKWLNSSLSGCLRMLQLCVGIFVYFT
jgi:hypothetical protein